MRFILTLIGILTLSGLVSAHPLHLSIINIDFEGDSAKISIHFFDNEWLPHLAQCHPEATISNKADTLEYNQLYIVDYFTKSLVLRIENTIAPLKYFEKKVEGGSLWYYFNAIIPDKNEILTIENRILTDCFGDQKNLVIIKKGNFESGLEFDSTKTSAEVKLK